MTKILLLASIDFEGYPTGGVSTFSDKIIKSFGNEIALVGISTNKSYRVGRWQKKTISGIEHSFLPVLYLKKENNKKPLIPARLKWFLALRLNKKKILSYNVKNVIAQSSDTILAIYNWKLNICYRFAGLTNPLIQSRFKWSRLLAGVFEKKFIPKLRYVNTFFAASSKTEIEEYTRKVKDYGFSININQITTKYDPAVFYKREKKYVHKELPIPANAKIIITSGRLSSVKGWDLIINSFTIFQRTNSNSILIFVGDGEDRRKIAAYIRLKNMENHIFLVGYQTPDVLSKYLNSADLYVMGSIYEGWPTTMVEALACGLPVCTSGFLSAKEIINSNKLGYVVEDRDPKKFAFLMEKAIHIEYDELFYKTELEKYSSKNLRNEIVENWLID